MFESNNPKPAPSSFDLLNDGNTKSYEFPPLVDFPLQSQDEIIGCLKKRPQSPDLLVSNKKLTCNIISSANCKKAEAADCRVKAEESKPHTAAKKLKIANSLKLEELGIDPIGGKNQKVGNWKVEGHEVDAPITDAKLKQPSTANVCKLLDDTSMSVPTKDTVMLAAGALTSFAVRAVSASNTSTSSTEMGLEESFGSRDPNTVIDLIPINNDTSILSDYNNLLVRNIEFFYPYKSHLNYENLSGSKNASNMSATRLGLRCIHCKNSTTHVTAAAFFPSTIASIASGLGTIGSRHFGLGKCPNIHSDLVHQMVETKKTSSIQTRTNGRIGLDAHCRNIAHQYGIFDDEVSGICWVDGKSHPSIQVDRSSIASVLAGMKHATNTDMRSFVPAEMACFWECNGCRSVEIPFRAKGSVVFSVEEPTPELIEDHLRVCNGRKPLMVPRNAAIEPFYGNYDGALLPPIRVKWESSKGKAKEGRSRRTSPTDNGIPDGVDEDPLCFDTDRPYTTDFAFFIVSQLARCHLTKTGRSRGACPIGYAGLACRHCAGDSNERRFFYSTADQMRNSFSHIPTHLAACEKCPTEIKNKIEEYKATRNRQKSLLKPGYHKIFIDRVWDRMHNGKQKHLTSNVASLNNTDTALALQSNAKCGVSHGQPNSTISRNVSSIINASSSALVQEKDKQLTSDLTLFVLLQVEPYSMLGSSDADGDSKEIGFPGLICSHCKTRKFFTTSGEHLSGLLVTISNHMQSCQSCPKSVRSLITQFRGTHEKQLKQVTVKSHDECMTNVWSRLVEASRSTKRKTKGDLTDDKDNVCYLPVDQKKSLVTPEDENLVTEFTYFTMKQVRACNLDKSMNGSRSQFADGFPGIECLHCANTSNPRRFFYRTVEILSGNYAHIPNHLATCAHCPAEIRTILAEKKEDHMRLKHKLDRGSQKRFFNNIWDRLHACSHK